MTGAKRVYRIQSLERAVRILDVIAAAGQPMRMWEVAEAARLHRVTAHRFLHALAALELLESDGEGHWQLGRMIEVWGELRAAREVCK